MTQEVTNFGSCPYCGKTDQPCSDITSEARANARAFCRKKHNYEPLEKLSTGILEDLE
jgi:hypothetical protein